MAHGEFWMDRFGKKSHIPFEELSPGQSCPDLFRLRFPKRPAAQSARGGKRLRQSRPREEPELLRQRAKGA
jgi:hypothetical protein